MVYLVVAAVSGTVFVFCSFWVYYFVDPEHDTMHLADVEVEDAENAMEAERLQSLQSS